MVVFVADPSGAVWGVEVEASGADSTSGGGGGGGGGILGVTDLELTRARRGSAAMLLDIANSA